MSENNESPKTEKPTFRRVLVVEDDEGLNKLAQKALREIGCGTVGISNGAEAIEYVTANPGVVLLLDIKLPDMTGGELISVLNERSCSVPFIAMTGHGDERTAVEIMKLGARDYLVKDLDLVHRLPGVFERLFRELDTERKLLAATKKLHESEERFRAIFEQAGDYILLLKVSEDRGLVIVDANQAACKIHGYTHEEFIGMSIMDLDRRLNEEQARAILEQVMSCGHARFETTNARKDGTAISVEVSCSLLDTGDGPPVIISIERDITERQRAEEERRQLEQQMQQTQKLESLGVMAGGIAHDFNNILYTILGNADIALEAMPPEAVGRSSLHEIQMAARRASGLTDQMLAYSGKGALAIEKMHLSELVQEMAHLLEVSHTKKAILKYHFEESLPAIEGDASQLRQVVMNLITNASEAEGDKGGIIAVTTGVTEVTAEYLAATYANDGLPGGRYVYLEVTDTGCGMDEATQRRIFEPFFTTKFTGRGLGMAAVLGIVRAHKGAIDIQSEVDHGTAIKVLFPALDEPAASPTQEPPREEDWHGRGTVLVVDDEASILKLTKRLLERKGFAVLTAEDGKQAVEVFRENRDAIVCVLLDLTMPCMGGEEAFVEIHQIRKDVPVVLASGYSEEQLKERVENLGFAGFLKKPVQNRDLLDKVRAVLKL